MACCIAIAFVFAAARSARAWILGRGPMEEVFPPTATWRSGHDAGMPVRDTSGTPARRGVEAPRGHVFVATVLAYGLLGHLLVGTGAAHLTDATHGGWPVRDAVLVGAAAVVTVVVRRPMSTASALVGAGALWFVLGIVDMHVLGAFEFAAAPFVLDAAFHLSGWWLMVAAAGVAVVKRRANGVEVGTIGAAA